MLIRMLAPGHGARFRNGVQEPDIIKLLIEHGGDPAQPMHEY